MDQYQSQQNQRALSLQRLLPLNCVKRNGTRKCRRYYMTDLNI